MMHSGSLDRNGSPRKRTLSRGISEDETLRSIIKETECSSRRLVRSESRNSIVKRRSESQDLYAGVTDMLDLQVSYDEVVQELRGLEVERETLVFQVDILQDTLESVEELLAEAQREARQVCLELEQERVAKKKLEAMVCSLMRDVESLKEERNMAPSVSRECGEEDTNTADREPALTNDEPSESVFQTQPGHNGVESEKAGKGDTAAYEASPQRKLQKMFADTMEQLPSLALDWRLHEGVLRRLHEGQAEDGRDVSPERSNDTDSTSAYEDACATPELERAFPGDSGEELPHDDDAMDERGSTANKCRSNASGVESLINPDSPTCILS